MCLHCGELNSEDVSKCKNCRQFNPFEIGTYYCKPCGGTQADKNNQCVKCHSEMTYRVDLKASAFTDEQNQQSFESIEWFRVHFYRVLGKAEIKVGVTLGLVMMLILGGIAYSTPDFGYFDLFTVGYAFIILGVLLNMVCQAIFGRKALESTIQKLELPKDAYVHINSTLPKNVLLNIIQNRVGYFVGKMKTRRFKRVVPNFIEKFAIWESTAPDINSNCQLKKK